MPAPTYRLPVPPIPNLSERVLPKKSSMSTLRLALTRKSSTNTLRSTRSSTHLPCGMTHHYDVPPLPLHLPPPQPRWRDANLPTINLHDADRSAGFLPSTMLSKNFRPPKTSIGQPRIQPSKSPSAFLEYIPRRAPGMPKKENPLPALPSSDDARPLPLPDLVHISENMTMDSEDLDTPDSTIVANCEALSESLSLQASRAETALKPERLLSVLRRQHKDLHGSQTPPVAGRRANKPTGDVSALLDKVPAPTIRSSNGRCTSDSSRYAQLVETHARSRSGRDPLGIMLRLDTAQSVPGEEGNDAPLRSGAGNRSCTPALSIRNGKNKENQVNDYFGSSEPENATGSTTERTSFAAFDFSASPVRDGLPKSSVTSIDSESLPSDIWELKAFLDNADHISRQRSVRYELLTG